MAAESKFSGKVRSNETKNGCGGDYGVLSKFINVS